MYERKKWSSHSSKLTLALCFLLLSACGFKLRGIANIPSWFNNVAIVNQGGQKDLTTLLKNQLKAFNIHTVENPAKADYILIIEHDSLQQKITSISASTTPRQYQLLYTVTYSITRHDAKPIISSKLVTVTRQLTVNNDRILGSDSEELLISKAMRQDAVMQIMGRLER